jgi:flagellin
MVTSRKQAVTQEADIMVTINTNIGALAAQSNMSRVNEQFNTAMTRLSTGLRINAAKDDAAGMAIGEKMTAQIMGLNQAVRNATDGKNLVDTTEGAHVEVSSMLQRLRELAVQSANDTNTASDRGSLMSEGNQLVSEINRVAQNTTFNGMNVLDGSFTGKQLQIGADTGQVLRIDVDSAAAKDIGAHTVTSKASLASNTADTGIAAGTALNVSGYMGGATVTTTAGQSAKSLAAQVNGVTSSTGVQATASTAAKLSGFSAASTVSFKVNDVSIGTVNISDTSDLRSLRDAINTVSGRTGVTATMGENNSEVVLNDATGNDIALSSYDTGVDDTTMTVTVLDREGNAAGSVEGTHKSTMTDTTSAVTSSNITGQVSMTSAKSFSVSSSVTTAGASFFESTDNSAKLQSVAEIDLSTAKGASDAITVIDVALQKISQSRADLGAVSNRLDSTISNLTNISVSVQAAKSNVMDADFAAESTNLAKGQILSQAATAMLAQANSSKQNVMSLLKG